MTTLEQDTCARKSVLIAEDSPTQAERLRHTLERNGYLVIPTTNGREALQAAKRNMPDLLISDIVMPEMDGYQLCQKIKADSELDHIPVMLLTTLSDPQDVIRGLECRADNFIVKPYDEQYLLSHVQFVLLNHAVRPDERDQQAVEIQFAGQRHLINANRFLILNLLLSTYETAIQRNQELIRAKEELRTANTSLEDTNRELQNVVASEREAMHALKSAQSQLVQAEKLASLGQMVAGVAHEINNPLAFVTNNLWVLQRDLADIPTLLQERRRCDEVASAESSHPRGRAGGVGDKRGLDVTLQELNNLLDSSREGLKRIEGIVTDLRDFARLDRAEMQDADLNSGISSTVNIIRGRAKGKNVEIELDLKPLPLVGCYPAKVNQVIMNLLSNAIDASESGGTVTIATRQDDRFVCIEVADSGTGIDPAIRDQIFDPFFTTKPVGDGTGLGLSISYGIVRDHNGRIEVQSTVGDGSRFTVWLPLKRESVNLQHELKPRSSRNQVQPAR